MATQDSRSPRGSSALDEVVGRALSDERAGRVDEAVAGYRAALALDPGSADAHMLLGGALATLGFSEQALRHCRRAVDLRPDSARLRHNLSVTLAELGQWDEAVLESRRAVALEPGRAQGLANLGLLLTEVGRSAEAEQMLRRATVLSVVEPGPYFDLYRAVFDDRDLRPAIDALTGAVTTDFGFALARFSLGVALELAGDEKAARRYLGNLHPDRAAFRGALDSWEYVKTHRGPATRIFTTTRETLLFSLAAATGPGLLVELGVRHGTSARWLAESTPATLHAFDSFEGLPEAWHTVPRGAYTTHGALPAVPPNVELHVGLFEDTLPRFLERHAGPLRFVNVDCDLYGSTLCALEALAERVVRGTVLLFDEYLIADTWREDEFKAFQEVSARHGWRHEYVAFNLFTGQAAARIL